jgi:rod shape-determining protein MreD
VAQPVRRAADQHGAPGPHRLDARPAGAGHRVRGCAPADALGQHALSYTTLGFFAITIHRRLLWYPVLSQALQVLPLFALSHVIELGIRIIGGGVFPGWSVLLAPLIEAALWPLVSALLLAPQRRTPEPDANRPL